MQDKTARRARNDAILNMALRNAQALGLNELEMFERLVHVLLNWKDDMFQREIDARMNSVKPLFLDGGAAIPCTSLLAASVALKEYLESPACAVEGFDIPDAIWMPFADVAEAEDEKANSGAALSRPGHTPRHRPYAPGNVINQPNPASAGEGEE